MKLAGLGRLLVVASFCLLLRVDHAKGNTFAVPPATDRPAWFLDMLMTLADLDGPGDPAKVGEVLGVRFDRRVVTTSPSFFEHWGRSFERDEYTPATTAWFVPGPPGFVYEGYGQADLPPSVMTLQYFESKRFGVAAGPVDIVAFDHLRDDSEVHLVFEGIDQFACITVDDVKSRIPGVVHVEETDASVERYAYYPPSRAEAGTVLTIYVPLGRCITQASVGDTPTFGRRYARAQSRFFACLKRAAQEFCGSNPGDPQYAAFNEHARRRCGNLDQYFDEEPRMGPAPVPNVDLAEAPTSCLPTPPR